MNDTSDRITHQVEDLFPEIELNEIALGDNIVVQMKTPPKQSKGGILYSAETQDIEEYSSTVGKVLDIGPTAFHFFSQNDESNKPWPGGAWFKVGDFVRLPRHGGQRIESAYGVIQIISASLVLSIVKDPTKYDFSC